MKKQPLITIAIMTEFPYGEGLKKTIECALAQQWDNLEIIVPVEGLEAGRMPGMASSLSCTERIKWVSCDGAMSRPALLNHLLGFAVGEYITFFEVGDYSRPDRLQQQYDRLSTYHEGPERVLCFCNRELVALNGDVTIGQGIGLFEPEPWGEMVSRKLLTGKGPGRYIFGMLGTGTLMAKREVFDVLGPFDTTLESGEDFDYAVRAGFEGFYFISANEPVVRVNAVSDKASAAYLLGIRVRLIRKYREFLVADGAYGYSMIMAHAEAQKGFGNRLRYKFLRSVAMQARFWSKSAPGRKAAFSTCARPDAIRLYWYTAKFNYGDQVNPYLVRKLSGKSVCYSDIEDHEAKYFVIGSILHHGDLTNVTVWGSGVISPEYELHGRPRSILAVRGPLSRDHLLALGLDCPAVYGDPAILLPQVYAPEIEAKYDLGIVPHEVDKGHPWLEKMKTDDRILIVDIQSPVEQVVHDILSCRAIASSALHGIITATAYGLPVCWLEFGDKVVGAGFKFRDFYASAGVAEPKPLAVAQSTRFSEIMSGMTRLSVAHLIDPLLETCPFKHNN